MKAGAFLVGIATVASALAASQANAFPQVVNVKDCYNGGTDDNALHNAFAVAQGATGFGSCGIAGSSAYIGAVYVPPGVYQQTTNLTITTALTISGVRGRFTGTGSVINASSAVTRMLDIQTDSPVLITDLDLDASSQPSGSAAIYVAGSTGSENNASVIERVTITGAQTGIFLAATTQAVIRSVHLEEPRVYGVYIKNTFNKDHGDATIEGSTIGSGQAGSVGIHQVSSGGLRLHNNKIIGGGPTPMAIGYRMALEPGANTSILIITGNSIEGQVDRGIQLYRTSSDAFFSHVIINDNQFASAEVGLEVFDAATGLGTPSADWLQGLTVSGNVFHDNSNSSIALHQLNAAFIVGNIFRGSGNGLWFNTTGVTPANVKVGGNTYLNVSTHIAGASVVTQCPPSTCN